MRKKHSKSLKCSMHRLANSSSFQDKVSGRNLNDREDSPVMYSTSAFVLVQQLYKACLYQHRGKFDVSMVSPLSS